MAELSALSGEGGCRTLAEHYQLLANDGMQHHVVRSGRVGWAMEHDVAFA